MMVKALLYAYCIGVPSSRKIAKRLEEDIAFRVLAAAVSMAQRQRFKEMRRLVI